MIHDGLRVDIAIVKDMNKLIRKQMKAIDAIVELHKSFTEHNVCKEDGYGYPCPTIQAIKKELM